MVNESLLFEANFGESGDGDDSNDAGSYQSSRKEEEKNDMEAADMQLTPLANPHEEDEPEEMTEPSRFSQQSTSYED